MRRRRKKFSSISKLKLKNSTRVSLVLLSLVIFAFSSASLLKMLFGTKVIEKDEEIYNYKNKFASDYTVNIKDNRFITDSTLPSGETYVSDLIDSIDMDLKYNYNDSKATLLEYHYKIDAIISASYSNDGKDYVVWNKTYNLKDVDKKELHEATNINIDEKVNVDYSKYHQEVKDFRQTMGMTLNSHLYVRLTVNTSTKVNGQEVENEYSSNFSVTIGDKIAIVDGKLEDKNVGNLSQTNVIEKSNINAKSLVFNLTLMTISINVIYYIAFKTKKSHIIKNEFRLELNRILKSCQDKIVFVKNKIEIDGEDYIEVNDFGELVKLSEELYKPILCWVSDSLTDECAYFSVMGNRVRYRYILKKEN